MDGDRPISRREDDRLGFAPIADQLASAILALPATEGFVFGIEGQWGSGKSTLINLTIEALKNQVSVGPEIVTFAPWLVGDRDDLLRNLFDELASAAVKIDPIETPAIEPGAGLWSWKRLFLGRNWGLREKERLRKAVGSKLRTFGKIAGAVGKISRVGGALGIPGGEFVGTAVERGGLAAKEVMQPESVLKRKLELVEALKHLSRRITVFIDDLDRLEPREVSEVLRLIRAVADFPNVIYVLSYDPDIIAQTLTKPIHVRDGAAFLKKMVQVSFAMPRPEAFDLRRWFREEVNRLFFAVVDERESSRDERLAEIIDVYGGRYLKTGRDVVRTLNALRLHGLPVRNLIDISDMVWLQLVRIGNPALYSWTEEYLTEVAAIAGGARASNEEAEAMASRLQAVLAGEDFNLDYALISLEEILPGIYEEVKLVHTRERRRVFNRLTEQSFRQFVEKRRLGSPQHYRYYFAFEHPAGALSDEQVRNFIELAGRAPLDAVEMFAVFARTTRPQGGTMAEVLIDRIGAIAHRISMAAIPGIVASMASTMDVPALSSASADFGEARAWLAANRALKALLDHMTKDLREVSIHTLFVEGQALGWLTDILRGEIFSHGHFGNQVEPENRWLLTAQEFTHVLSIMLQRYRDTPPERVLGVPRLLSLLFAWQQGSGTDEARKWVETHTGTDSELLRFLSRVRSWRVSSNAGVQYPLRRRELEHFLDFDDAVARVDRIASDSSSSERDRELAAELKVAIEQGEDR